MVPDVPDCDWLLVVSTATLPAPAALAWLGWAAAQVGSAAIYADEDRVAAPGAPPERPVLKAAPDPEAALYGHGLLAVRAAAARPLLAAALAAPDPLAALAAGLAGAGLAHLPRILSSRLADPPPPPPAVGPAGERVGACRAIGVVIPTRNGGAATRPLPGGPATAAERPDALDGRGAGQRLGRRRDARPACRMRSAGAATVIADAAPFNWARLSNRGAAACRADLLLFLNDDVEITTPGWDAALRRQLGAARSARSAPGWATPRAGCSTVAWCWVRTAGPNTKASRRSAFRPTSPPAGRRAGGSAR